MLFKKLVNCCRQYCELRNADAEYKRRGPYFHILKSKPQTQAQDRELQNKHMERNDRHDGIGLILALVLDNDADAPPCNKEKSDTGKRTDDKTVGDSPVPVKKRNGDQGQSDEDR